MKYSLACSCGRTIAVETSQCGETLSCSCGRAVIVPTLRVLRAQPVVEESAAAAPRRPWSTGRGFAFVAGVLVVFAGLTAAAYFSIALGSVPVPPTAIPEPATASEAWDEWQNLTLGGIEIVSMEAAVRKVRGELKTYRLIGGAVAGVGLVVIVLSVRSRAAS